MRAAWNNGKLLRVFRGHGRCSSGFLGLTSPHQCVCIFPVPRVLWGQEQRLRLSASAGRTVDPHVNILSAVVGLLSLEDVLLDRFKSQWKDHMIYLGARTIKCPDGLGLRPSVKLVAGMWLIGCPELVPALKC